MVFVDLQVLFMGTRTQAKTVASVVLVAAVLVSWNRISAAKASSSSSQPRVMIRRCVQNLTKQIRSPIPIRFQERTDAPWGSEVREVLLTNEGRVDRLIAIGDQPLTAAQQKKEVDRLNSLLQRSTARPLMRDQDEEQQRRLRLVAAIPTAFAYQISAEPEPGIQELTFRPSEHFHPENRETRVYQGMRGILQIDTRHEQLLRVDGEIFRKVSFGWGILGNLHRGGHFRIEQHEVLSGHWEITEMDFDFTYTIFFFSTKHYVRKTSNTAYTLIDPGTRLSEAIQLLLTEPSNMSIRNSFAGSYANSPSAADSRTEGQNTPLEKNRRPTDRFPSSYTRRPPVGHAVLPLFRQTPHWRATPGNITQQAKANGKWGFQ